MKYFCLLFISLQLLQLTATAQTDLVKSEGITSVVQQSNIGKIIFTKNDIQRDSITANDFQKEYTLTNKSNLFMHIFMNNSMTNYMHKLAPALSADSIVRIGNYQFTFFVDSQLVYQSNLWPGGPDAKTQHTATAISRPLINYEHEGESWAQYLWNRFMYNGGDSVLTDGKHHFRLEIRPYVKINEEVKSGELIASGDLNLVVKRKPTIDIGKIQLNQIKPYDCFSVSGESFDREKIKLLKGKIEAGIFKHITTVVVIKNGKILIEEYFDGANRNSLHDPRSVGKSFASTMAGIAIGQGYLKNEQQTLDEFYKLKDFANYSSLKEKISLRDLLTMSSAFNGNDDDNNSPGNEENMYPTDNWVKFALDLPIDSIKPKGEWNYFTTGVVLLGDIIHKSVPDGLEKYADEKLFKPLHIENYQWQYTPQHVANTAGGIQLKALDFAKYGQLYKNNGKWQGKQLIPASWVNKTFTKQKMIPGRNKEYYGYLFWNKTYSVKGKKLETFYCAGNGGNKIFVFKDQPLVIVVTATAYGAYYAHPQVDTMMKEYILPAVVNISSY